MAGGFHHHWLISGRSPSGRQEVKHATPIARSDRSNRESAEALPDMYQ